MANETTALILCCVLALLDNAPGQTQSSQPWPGPIPCRVQDGPNKDLWVMTLGQPQTSLADGVFDPLSDQVTLKDGSVKSNYFRDTLKVPFYRPLDKSHYPLPPSGWCTWYYYYNRINADEVKRNTDWIAANLKDFGAQYVQIDDGWQGLGGRDGGRDWSHVNPERFPKGMADLAAYIKTAGLKPGLWLAPHGQSNPEVVKNNPDTFLLRTNGESASDTWEGRFLLDPTTPQAHQYFHDLFQQLAGWGYDYFKIDGQPIVVDEYRARKQFMKNPSDDAPALYRSTLEDIRNVIGPDRYLLGCWGIPLEGAGIMNGSRTGGDIVLGWGGFNVSLQATLHYYFMHNIVWYSDPDVVVVRSPLTLDQARVWATLQGLTGQALMSSDRLMDLSPERVELLKRIYPATDIRPLDLFPVERNKRIWDLKINHLGRNYDVVGVFNFNEGQTERTFLSWEELGLPTNQPMHVFDFWNAEYLGAWKGGLSVPVTPTSCRVLTLVPCEDRIQLVSTSRHITQGWIDLIDNSANDSGTEQKGTSVLVKNDPYEIRFAFPPGTNFAVKVATAHGPSGELPVRINNHQQWASISFASPEAGEVKWEATFEAAPYYHFPPSPPEGLWVERVGLDGVNLHWREQYYLNNGYNVTLNDELVGHSSEAQFPLRGLNATNSYTAQVRTVWEDGKSSPRAGEAKFTLASLLPEELQLTELEPAKSNGRWRGFEADETLSGAPLLIHGRHYRGLSSFANSESEYDIKGIFSVFSAAVGVDESSRSETALEFIVLGDGKELWRTNQVTSAQAPVPVHVDITGVRALTLQVKGPGRRSRVQADWVEPKLESQP
jgi:hypothetical protein